MALPTSSLSISCNSIANFVRAGLDAANNNIQVMIGTPEEAAKKKNQHRLNLFFYRFEPSGFQAAVQPDEPWLIRLDCLITAFGIQEDTIGPGENELRILGEVLRLFHQTPVLGMVKVDGEDVRLQVVFQPLSSDELNQVWSTQSDTSYRPSIAYEMALVPVVPSVRSPGRRLVGSAGSRVDANLESSMAPYSGEFDAPPVAAETVNSRRSDWAPLICFIAGGKFLKSISLAVDSPELTAFSPRVWVAGDSSATVTLRWTIWDLNAGWRETGQSKEVSPISVGIDPESGPPSMPPTMALPFKDRPGQAVLYAERQHTRQSNGARLTIRSNPLLVTLY